MKSVRAQVNGRLSDAVAQSAMMQFPGLLFMILYWVFTSDEGYYTSECVDLLAWSNVVLYLSATGFFISCASIPSMFFVIFCFQSIMIFNIVAYFYLIFTVFYMMSLLVVFSGVCYAYSENEECGDLRILNVVYVVVYAILMTLVMIWGCVVLVCMLKHKRKKKEKKNEKLEKEGGQKEKYGKFEDEK